MLTVMLLVSPVVARMSASTWLLDVFGDLEAGDAEAQDDVDGDGRNAIGVVDGHGDTVAWQVAGRPGRSAGTGDAPGNVHHRVGDTGS